MATAATTARPAADAGPAGPVVPRPPAGSGGLLVLWPLVCLQAAGALVVGGLAVSGPWRPVVWALAALPVALLVLVAAAWRLGEPLPVRVGSALALRRRGRQAAGPLPAGGDPLVSLATECVPGLVGHPFAGRDRREIGMVADGGSLTAALRVEASLAPLQPGHGVRPLPLSLLHEALETDGICLESVQSVQHTQPAPAPQLPDRSVAGASYALLQPQGPGGAPALRLTWVALRLDPELCPAAVAERGGGLPGAQRALARAADQLASRLAAAGFRATVLTEGELLAAVAACTSSDPAATTLIGQAEGPRPRRTAEGARVWRCDDRWHTTFRVVRWPALGPGATPLPGLVALLTSLPAFATTFSLTLRRQGPRSVALGGHVRVTGRSEAELRAVSRQLLTAARGSRVTLARMDRQQLPGVRATLPLGGVR
ncbi:type VII secretion protein EccE [Streptomyces hainanensis]|uniref:Type VII secretion protein EccE n=1 Tax=Streptomyces hainanensis TaxID=402648 RepID=A0A4R4T104_9ACTN|nr:type VII secretion protein EccE [Streptomyces hainanensis]TDC70408.1 type VII secretion protein EccE [Streptomyces hainanensis]